MKKSNVRFGIVIAILLIIYNLLVFIIPFEQNGIFWLSYGFTLDAFVVASVACVIAFRSGKGITSKFYGFPVAKVGVIYLAIQIVLCFLFMALSQHSPVWLGVLIYAIALGAAVIGLVVTDTVRDHIQDQDIKLSNNISVVRTAQSKLNQMMTQCEDSSVAIAVKKFAEELRYSDPVSGPALAEAEADLSAAIDNLQQAIADGDTVAILALCKQGQLLLAERNRLCKLNKK